jgi:uncharacterized sulfatase
MLWKFFVAVLLFALTAPAASGAPAAQPNILIAIADDWSHPHAGAYGCKFVKTPAFDRVAREGVLFQHCFAPNPKCSPSRASMLTGMQSFQLEEACNHHGVFPAKFKVYPDLLEAAGYHVGHTGKGWGPGSWKLGGFTRNPCGPAYGTRRVDKPPKRISANDYAANFADFLAARKSADQPFCFWYGATEPHRPYERGAGRRAGKRLEDVDVPPYLPDDEIVRTDLLDYALEIEHFDAHLGRILDALEKAGELDNTIVIVTGDNGMPFPRAKANLYDSGARLPLAVRWGAKIPAGRTVTDFVTFADVAPTLLSAAGLDAHPQMSGRSFLDVLTSKESGRVDSSRDRAVIIQERHDLGRPGNVGYPTRALRTDEFLYVRQFEPDRWPASDPPDYRQIDNSPTKSLVLDLKGKGDETFWQMSMGKRPAEELYDVRTDPHCMKNLAADPAHAATKARLWKALETFLAEQRDPRVLGHGEVFDRYDYIQYETPVPPSTRAR